MPSGELHVDVVPLGPGPQAAHDAVRAALTHPAVRAEVSGTEHRLLSIRPVSDAAGDRGDEAPSTVRATIYDYTNERTVLVDAPVDGSGAPIVASSARQPVPTEAERGAALAVLDDDPALGPAIRDGRLTPYRPMPPLLSDELPDGRVVRAVTVGLQPAGDGSDHEIVAVRLARGEVVRFPDGAPPGALAGPHRCGPPAAGQPTAQGAPGSARVTVSRDGEVLWTLIANRPAASSGTNGSGVELRNVSYRGKRVLRRAHVPILNVRYDDDACGPYRDWQNEESMLTAAGTDAAPGFRLCTAPAQTMLESGHDHGNFLGVAVYVDGDEVVLVSELEAGWYRYVSAWRLAADGAIRPRFGFAAVHSSCVCNVHHHHAYWRLDFDVAGGGDCVVHEFNDPPVTGTANWHSLRHEIRRLRRASRGRRWKVLNRTTGESCTLEPGAGDGRADAFGVGDLWALRRRRGQVDDGQGFTTDASEARAHISRFLNHESIYGTDVVLWYAGHFSHDVEHHDDVGHIVGPTLTLQDW
ncbi:MAG TPA: hypothetical protein VK279_09415 [Solirubrobacteraceae bacterium]|nr:hypothetical protein [Solirubrobacteraceae bacterium]